MEALVAVSVAALTVYDMCKALDKGIVIARLVLESKTRWRQKRRLSPQENIRPNVEQRQNPAGRWQSHGHGHVGGGCCSIAQVTTAADGADALLKAVDDPSGSFGQRLPIAQHGWAPVRRQTSQPPSNSEHCGSLAGDKM